jgi:hypothetical protein
LKIYPALLFYSGMSVRYLIAASICSVVAGTASVNAAPQGSVEGQLKIVSQKPVELADENRTTETTAVPVTAKNYADYPLIILTQGERKQIARITADTEGNYRAALPPGEYIIDVEGRVPKRLHVRAQPFTVVPNETVHVDMTIVTGFGAEASATQE